MDFETIKGMIAEQLKVNPDEIKITVEDDQIMKLKTVGDVAAYVAKAKV